MKYLLLVAMFCTLGIAQEHKFWDSRQKVDFAVTSGIRTLDIVATCVTIARGGREVWLPVKSCGGVAAWIAAGQASQTGFQYWLHRGGHHRWERLVPWVMVSPNALGVGYTISGWGKHKVKAGESFPTPIGESPCFTVWTGTKWSTRCP